MSAQPIDELAEALSGWRFETPREDRKRQLSRDRKRRMKLGLRLCHCGAEMAADRDFCSPGCWRDDPPKFTRAELIAEVELHIGNDNGPAIAARLGYADLRTLNRRLVRCGRPDLANRLWKDVHPC